MTPRPATESNIHESSGIAAAGDYLTRIRHFRSFPFTNPTPIPKVTFSEFRKQVRRYRPSDLLPALARLATDGGFNPHGGLDTQGIQPWSIALVARESILWSNEYRRAEVTGDSLRKLFNACSNIYDRAQKREETDPDFILNLFTRISHLQFPYQQPYFAEVARTHAMLSDGLGEVPLEILDKQSWMQILGDPLPQVVGATHFIAIGAYKNNGWFDLEWLLRTDLDPIFEKWPRSVIEKRMVTLSATIPEFKAEYDSAPIPPVGYEEYAYNPLVKTPFIRMSETSFLAPQPKLIIPTITPSGLYHAGQKEFGSSFTNDLGVLTEHYVGKQLRSIDSDIVLHGEITYRQQKQEMKSIDWFLELPTVLVLIEVKSSRLTNLQQAAFGDHKTRIDKVLGKAMRQLRRTSKALEERRPEFAHISNTKPRVGIIVTAEPFHTANSSWMRELIGSAPFPTLTVSLRELENLVRLPFSEVERQITAIAHDPEKSTWIFDMALELHGTAPGLVD